MPSNQRQTTKQAKFTYSPLGKTLEKQTKTIGDQGKKQMKAIEDHGKQLVKSSIAKESLTHIFIYSLYREKEVTRKLLKNYTTI